MHSGKNVHLSAFVYVYFKSIFKDFAENHPISHPT